MLFLRLARLLLLAAICAASARAATAIPDVELQDQNGRKVKFYTDLVKDRVVAVNFIFTRCTTVCPGLGVSSAALARHLSETAGEGVTLPRIISISIDPETDTPERLRAWSENFGTAPGWTLVTGSRREIETLLKALQAYTPDINLHSSAFLLGNDATGQWKRVGGSAAPAKLAEALAELSVAPSAPVLAPAAPAPAVASLPAEGDASAAAARYFPDTVLLNQHGKPVHFYTDLLKGKVVVISTIFADCGGVCPLIVERFAKVQEKLGDRVGRDVTLISISVDPVNDTPERLHGYAERAGAKPGWHFLTGEKANVDFVLKRLGQYVESRDAHSNIFIIGNEPTGLWKKAFGLAPAEDVIEIVESVLTDRS
jgi:cytochrome oxidase Cu insertion factor (SCO1/SenC/PrrC family)